MEKLLKRISVNPQMCHGKPCIKGHRIMVYQILDYIADGAEFEEIIKEFHGITKADIVACLEYASSVIQNEDVHFVR